MSIPTGERARTIGPCDLTDPPPAAARPRTGRPVGRSRKPRVAERRFAGAVTVPADPPLLPADPDLVPVRPRRPLLLEFGAAILIVGGLVGVFGRVAAPDLVTSGPLELALLALNGLLIVVGLLVRAGRAWILDLNVVAIALFIELTALPSGVAMVFAGLDAIVLAALIRHRAWFDPATWPLEPVPDAAAGRRPRP